ncbi:hypothetical protein RAJCM14343_1473 [Rhodococcus aetherivorans]|uniref:Uncharacterized protein n=1 Tax=Rhodococcus aetherivorans TaxID=191292 RepID=A0ABQ0YI58_9NOCA|nr:hypothetical protein [Rhodococcus aetherivorans]GES36222.1 hypothetical protein RAJCM14343_1473 [Rhodococcus aetherivorans]
MFTVDKWIGVIAGVVAPTTVLTGLCYYFGYVSARAYFAHFGIDTDAFGFSTADYVLRSVSVLYPALVMLLAAGCVVFWTRAYGLRVLRRGRRSGLARRTGWVTSAVGALLTTLAVLAVVVPRFSVLRNPALVPVFLGLGAVLIVAGTGILAALRQVTTPQSASSAERATWLFAGAAVVLALFWLTNIFATEYGRAQAQNTAADLWDKETVVVLDTADRLFAPVNLVRESGLGAAPGQRFAYRYECLRALFARPEYWVLVPARWTAQYGYVLIVAVDESSRISVTRREGLADTPAANWDAQWPCPEVAPS